MITSYGQLVIGPPGSGKSTYCKEMAELLSKIGRKVIVINIDPANEHISYKVDIDISQLITVEDVMRHKKLGPNGGLMFCMEYLEQNMDWLLGCLSKFNGHYLLFDCPGQVELYTHHNSMKRIMLKLQSIGISLCSVHLIDSHYCSDPGKFISALLVTLSSMLQMELPHINILSKVDMMSRFSSKLEFPLEYYTEVLDLSYLLEGLTSDPLTNKYRKLNAAIISLIEDYSLVSFIPLNVKDNRLMINVKKAVDKANGYVYKSSEDQSVQALLSCASGAESDQERLGLTSDIYTSVNDANII